MPSQQLPAAVYWRRRLLLLAGLIAVVWVVMSFLPGDDGEPVSKPTATDATPEPVAATATDGPVQVSLTSGSEACDPLQVRVTPTVEDGQQAGGAVEIGLVISTTAEESCTLSVSDADLIAIISANDKAVWDSTVCKQSLLTESVKLSARWSTLVTTSWSGKGSGTACSKKEGWASGGTYVVQAGTLGGEPGKATFKLKAAPKPEKTNKDKKSDKDDKKSDKKKSDD